MSSDPKALTLAQRLDKLNEFERQPITADRLHSGRYFAGLFAGEHVAATEFVIGALFVQWGASARDLIWGLLLGNALAVLSWAFICSPIAVQTRLTLYWYVRRIIGPGLTVVYNFINAILYCCLAAAMIGVSASAVFVACNQLGLDLKHPDLNDVYPNSVGWVAVVLVVGAAVVTLAILGFKKLSQFATVCSPWMFSIFIAGAIASLPGLGDIKSFDDLKTIAETRIWTGEPYQNPLREVKAPLPAAARGAPLAKDLREELATETQEHWFLAVFQSTKVTLSEQATITTLPSKQEWRITDGEDRYFIREVEQEGKEPVLKIHKVLSTLGFWHIAFFAWFCNLAMHVGLSDMAVFRFARHWSYGFFSAFGMYLGHFVAWMCAGVMGAVVAGGLNPGEMANRAAGYAGVLAVLIAGWTTANPTIYRAGLALQIVTPNWPRWKVTLAAGAITTFVGFFPAIFMQLLNFVAIYGLSLMPIGAVIVMEHWVFPRIGLQRYWTERGKLLLNVPALISWLAVLVICFPIEMFAPIKSPMELVGIDLFFRWLPGWFIAAGLYVLLCYISGKAKGDGEQKQAVTPPESETPKTVPAKPSAEPAGVVAWLAGATALFALAMCIYLPLRVFIGGADPEVYAKNMEGYKSAMLITTLFYFAGAIYWFSRRERARSNT